MPSTPRNKRGTRHALTPQIKRAADVILGAVTFANGQVYEAWSIREALLTVHLWQRLVDAGYAHPEDPDEERPVTLDERRRIIMDRMYQRALGGDPQAVRQYFEYSGVEEKDKAFDVHVTITPYTIADKSLAAIVMDADEKPLEEILQAFAKRCRIDAFTEDLCVRAETLFADFLKEAILRYQDKPVERLAAMAETATPVSPRTLDQKLDAVIGAGATDDG